AEQDIDVSTAPADAPDPIVVAVPAPEVAPARTFDIPVPQPAAPDAVVIDDPAPEVPDVVVAEPEVAAPAGLQSGDGAVAVNRLGGQAAPAEAAAEKRPALEQFAAVYTGDDAKPLMGILLLDDGSMDGGPPAIASLPFGVTVVLDPAMEGATARMAEYRAAGIEVGVRSQLPDGATPADVEVTLESTFKTLPETVLLLDAGDGGLQNDRAVTAQAMERLAQDGRGLVTVSKGLNMAMRAAEQAEVPANVIFRDLDAEGQDARVIRRFMDQAAFRARQNSGVLLLARVRPDTISALVLWGTANRSGQVALAPVSAILKAQGE
ncbi:MAG: divergent polysaccharide deacetylase family protein, partial [Yoonia sp.]